MLYEEKKPPGKGQRPRESVYAPESEHRLQKENHNGKESKEVKGSFNTDGYNNTVGSADSHHNHSCNITYRIVKFWVMFRKA